MANNSARDRYLTWLQYTMGVDVVSTDEKFGTQTSGVRGRLRPPSSFRLKFAGIAGMFLASIVLMAGSRPGISQTHREAPATLQYVGYGIGGLAVGALALGFRVQRTRSQDVWVSLPLDGQTPTAARVDALAREADDVRRDAGATWKPGQVWLVSTAQLDGATKNAARDAQIRCFVASPDGSVREV